MLPVKLRYSLFERLSLKTMRYADQPGSCS